MASEEKGTTTWLNSGNNKNGIGINFHRIQYTDKMGEKTTVLVDAGNMFVDKKKTGIDSVILDVSEHFMDADALFLSHGHLDHVGSIAHMIALEYPVPPIYATPYTIAVLRQQLKNLGVPSEHNPEINIIGPSQGKLSSSVDIGPIEITAFAQSHSIHGAVAFGIKTPSVTLFDTGDGRLNPMRIGYETAIPEIRDYFNKGVDFLLVDSTSTVAETMPYTEEEVTKDLARIFDENRGKDISVFTISNNGPRFLSAIVAAGMAGYDLVMVAGGAARSAWAAGKGIATLDDNFDVEKKAAKILRSLGINKTVAVYDAQWGKGKAGSRKYITIATGANGERGSIADRMAMPVVEGINDDYADVGPNTVAVFSQRTIPGNEEVVGELKKNLKKKGVNVVDSKHASGHASRPETHTFISEITRDSGTAGMILIPIHGNEEHREATADLAREMNINAQHAERGDVVLLEPGKVEVIDNVPMKMLGIVNNAPRNIDVVDLTYYPVEEVDGKMVMDKTMGVDYKVNKKALKVKGMEKDSELPKKQHKQKKNQSGEKTKKQLKKEARRMAKPTARQQQAVNQAYGGRSR